MSKLQMPTDTKTYIVLDEGDIILSIPKYCSQMESLFLPSSRDTGMFKQEKLSSNKINLNSFVFQKLHWGPCL